MHDSEWCRLADRPLNFYGLHHNSINEKGDMPLPPVQSHLGILKFKSKHGAILEKTLLTKELISSTPSLSGIAIHTYSFCLYLMRGCLIRSMWGPIQMNLQLSNRPKQFISKESYLLYWTGLQFMSCHVLGEYSYTNHLHELYLLHWHLGLNHEKWYYQYFTWAECTGSINWSAFLL